MGESKLNIDANTCVYIASRKRLDADVFMREKKIEEHKKNARACMCSVPPTSRQMLCVVSHAPKRQLFDERQPQSRGHAVCTLTDTSNSSFSCSPPRPAPAPLVRPSRPWAASRVPSTASPIGA